MDTTYQVPTRLPTKEDYEKYVPTHVVWEITLACNLKCQHCGSRAGKARPSELSTAECLEVVDQLARLGTREITLIGGEAYLRRDWTEIIRAIRSHDIYCGVQTGARNLTDERLSKAIEAGLQGIGVSVDGLREVHDKFRGVPGSYEMAIDALKRAKAAGLKTSVNTVIGSPNFRQLPEIMEQIIAAGATHWQIQLAVAMGNAVDNEEILLQPYQLSELMPMLAQLYHEGIDRGLLMIPGNNIGYFGPFEHIWRSYNPQQPHWTGCSAGQTGMGLESDGTVKGCPSLSTVDYAGGNIRDLSLEDIWRSSEGLHFGRLRSVDSLWGFCRSCYYAELCRGGCTWTADSLFGRPGNNPYCHYRVLELEKRGLRERVVKKSDALQQPFAIGEFELITEPIPGVEVTGAVPAETLPPPPAMPMKLVQLTGRTTRQRHHAREVGEAPPQLEMCHACNYYIWPGEETCPHCGADIKAALEIYQADVMRRSALIAEVEGWIREMQSESTREAPELIV